MVLSGEMDKKRPLYGLGEEDQGDKKESYCGELGVDVATRKAQGEPKGITCSKINQRPMKGTIPRWCSHWRSKRFGTSVWNQEGWLRPVQVT